MKEQFRDSSSAKKISHVQFTALGPHQIQRVSNVPIFSKDLYRLPERSPAAHGPLDRRLGTFDKQLPCRTCGEDIKDCQGHYGHIDLQLPVFHIGFFRAIFTTLQRICKTCCHVLLPEEMIATYLRKLSNPELESVTRKAIVKEIGEACRKYSICPHCGSFNGLVKKVSALKIIHEKYVGKNEQSGEFRRQHDFAEKAVKDLGKYLDAGRLQEDLHPLRVLELFKQIPDRHCILLDMDPGTSRPENLIIQTLIVPPGCLRPSVAMDSTGTSGSNEDPLSIILADILLCNETIARYLVDAPKPPGKGNGQKLERIMETWEFLQIRCGLYFNGEMTNLPPAHQPKRPPRGFYQRLKGKQGRFRGNLSGKRVNFSARTVISPDPNLGIDEVAVPQFVSKTLTFPSMVTSTNIEDMRQLVRNGPHVHPGANTLVKKRTGDKKNLRFGNRKMLARDLEIGDVVHRHINDGDYVLFNRQPSLHRLSIMCHKVKVKPWRTFRFNECVCKPYNADFDGDEMNLHVPQTEEARAEAATLMATTENICTPCNGNPLIAACQDFITGAYLLTNKDVFLTKAKFSQLVCYLGDAQLLVSLPPPAIRKPMALWTGKQVIDLLLRPSTKSETLLYLEATNRSYDREFAKKVEKDNKRYITLGEKTLCPNDGFVYIRNSQLVSGFLDKAIIGESKATIFYKMLRDYGTHEAAECMKRLSKVTTRFLMERGFSIGIDDVTPSEELAAEKNRIVEAGYSSCDEHIRTFKTGNIVCQPGCTAEQTLEALMRKDLNDIREKAGTVCRETLPSSNAPKIMATCGSKGSNLNMSQMIACVGQQIINGERVPDGFYGRSLPHFAPGDKTPPAKGFVRNSFFTGLTPTEFFFHTMSGREGLVDTAVKTAETGYMQRRLMKALEDLCVQYDLTVRNASGTLIQFCYGDDGLDPTYLECDNAVDLEHMFKHTLASVEAAASEPTLTPAQMRDHFETMIKSSEFDGLREPRAPPGLDLKGREHFFFDHMREFVHAQAAELTSLRKRLGLNPCTDNSSTMPNLKHPREKLLRNMFCITQRQLETFIRRCITKFVHAMVEPGTAVGALGAQSIGEPGTQMTLRTFHFAGVAAMNVTLGVPRIKEIINAAKTISTPFMEAVLENPRDGEMARRIKGRVETTTLGQLLEYTDVVCNDQGGYVVAKLDLKRIKDLMLEININTIVDSIVAHRKLKLKHKDISPINSDTIRIYPPETSKQQINQLHLLQHISHQLPDVIVQGIPEIKRAIVNKTADEHELLIEGTNMRRVMATNGIVGEQLKCNHVMEVEKTLGIEAARTVIMDQVQETMGNYGIKIDNRHTMLVGDLMTFKGEVLGITRFGIAKMKDSVFMLASFEKTADHLFEAAQRGTKDPVAGVSESIIVGEPISLGTGHFKLLHQSPTTQLEKRQLLFDRPEFHPPVA